MGTRDRITIYYFSSTGNSLKASIDIASKYNKYELVKVSYDRIASHPDSEIVGFVFPVYMGSVPDIMKRFLSEFPFRKGVYYFAIGTYYKYKGIALSVVSNLFNNNRAILNYANYIPTVGNCLMEYEVSDRKRKPILEKADKITKGIIDDIKNKRENIISNYSSFSELFHNWIFNLFFKNTYKKFSVENECLSCGICVKVCPTNNITLKNDKPQWGKGCISCHACVHWCPKNAINIGRSKDRLQYHNPATKVTMFMNRNCV